MHKSFSVSFRLEFINLTMHWVQRPAEQSQVALVGAWSSETPKALQAHLYGRVLHSECVFSA